MQPKKNGATLYYCDPEKNTECRKTGCAHVLTKTEGGVCFITLREEYARLDSNGRPMIYQKKGDEQNVSRTH